LTLLKRVGRPCSGPNHREDQRAETDHHIARHHRGGQPPRHEPEPRGLDEHRDEQQLVGERIEELAELRGPVEALREVSIHPVGGRRDDEKRERHAVLAGMQCHEDRPDQRQADQADEIGQMAHDPVQLSGLQPWGW